MPTLTVESPVLDVLKRSKCEGTNLFLPPEQLDRKLYEQVNKVLTNLGGKWNRATKSHVFPDDPAEAIQNAVMFGQVDRLVDHKKLTQFFATPKDLADRMASMARLEDHHRVLEPSAGEGVIVQAILDRCDGDKVVDICELDASRRQKLIKRFGAHVCPLGEDFLKVQVEPFWHYHRILMNPPFRNGQDVDHVTHAFSLLKPGGRLVAITAPGWTYRTDKKHATFRQFIDRHGSSVEELPAGTFKESGTDIRTMLIELHR